MEKLDINEVYEDLNEAITKEEISHSDVMAMFADFIQDTLDLAIELELDRDAQETLGDCMEALRRAQDVNVPGGES